jgi:hypothetical protein
MYKQLFVYLQHSEKTGILLNYYLVYFCFIIYTLKIIIGQLK